MVAKGLFQVKVKYPRLGSPKAVKGGTSDSASNGEAGIWQNALKEPQWARPHLARLDYTGLEP